MASRAPEGMSGRQKMAGVIAALAIVLALATVYKMWANTQVHVERSINLPVGSSEKMQAMKAKGQDSGDSPSDNINPGTMRGK